MGSFLSTESKWRRIVGFTNTSSIPFQIIPSVFWTIFVEFGAVLIRRIWKLFRIASMYSGV